MKKSKRISKKSKRPRKHRKPQKLKISLNNITDKGAIGDHLKGVANIIKDREVIRLKNTLMGQPRSGVQDVSNSIHKRVELYNLQHQNRPKGFNSIRGGYLV